MHRFFDIHTHIYPDILAPRAVASLERFYNFTCDGKGTIDDLTRSETEVGSVGCLLLGVATNAKQVDAVNGFLAATVREKSTPDFRLFAYGSVHQELENTASVVDPAIALGLCGFKIHPDIQRVNIDDERLYPFYEKIEGRMPIAFHMGDDRDEYQYSSIERLLRVKKRFPRLEVLAAHLGGYRCWDEAFRLADLDAIHFDCSSALIYLKKGEAETLIRTLGKERILFGTDYPVAYPRAELSRFDALEIDDDTRRTILLSNAEKMFGFKSGK